MMSESFAALIVVPDEFPSDRVVIFGEWLVEDGCRVESGCPVATIEGSKATIDIVAPNNGYLRRGTTRPSDETTTGAVVAAITPKPDTPLTGVFDPPRGMIDPKVFPESVKNEPSPPRTAELNSPMRGVRGAESGQRHVELAATRRRLAEALSTHNRTAVRSRAVVRVALDPVRTILGRLQAKIGMINYGELVAWSAAQVLPDFPEFNASYRQNEIRYYKHVNLGFVVDVGAELMVPVVHRAGNLSVKDFSVALKDLVLQAARGELSASACKNGTFTVSNVATQEIVDFDPILNVDQSAILGIASPDDGMFRLILTFDHRVAKGRQASGFLRSVTKHLTNLNIDAIE